MKPSFDPTPFEVCVYRVIADDRVETQVARSLDDLGAALADGWATTVDAARQIAQTVEEQTPEPPTEDKPADDDKPKRGSRKKK